MKKKSNSRGYLSQIAQPLLPGESVLKVRHIPAPAEYEHSPGVPVVEDRFEFSQALRPNRPRPSLKELPVATQSASSPLVKAPELPSVSEDLQTTVSMPLPNAKDLRGDAEDATPVPVSDKSSSRHAANGSIPMQSREETAVRATATPTNKHHDAPAVIPPNASEHAERQYTPSMTELRPSTPVAIDTPVRIASEMKSTDMNIPNSSEATPGRTSQATDSRVVHGRRVHIGTVEIRAVLPQPPAPPVPPRPMPEAAPSRGRSGSDDPLGRGLAWSYGLIQG